MEWREQGLTGIRLGGGTLYRQRPGKGGDENEVSEILPLARRVGGE